MKRAGEDFRVYIELLSESEWILALFGGKHVNDVFKFLVRWGYLADILVAGGELRFTLLGALVAAVIRVVAAVSGIQPAVGFVPFERSLYFGPVGKFGSHAQRHTSRFATRLGGRCVYFDQLVAAENLVHADAGVTSGPIWLHLAGSKVEKNWVKFAFTTAPREMSGVRASLMYWLYSVLSFSLLSHAGKNVRFLFLLKKIRVFRQWVYWNSIRN